ncbi:nucleoside-diphosphate kinase [Malassezia psittaci]|uniref:Nucleoside diphosphate kinase n=1 Tax=Malassezia psittaci TaxID=1821823 RepID=A0AAF0F7Q2_9BASI|nr:nucleoside-diphosphate kinase [Malassezia psittaci]
MFARLAIPNAMRGTARSFSTRAGAASRSSRMPLALAATVAVAGISLYARPSLHLEQIQRPIVGAGSDVSSRPTTIAGTFTTPSERSFIMIKPDGVNRQIVGKILTRFEERGYKLVAIKSVLPSKELAREHYGDLASKPFFGSLIDYITGGTPVIAMVWEGKDVIRQGRNMVGATNPLQALPGSIRGDYAVSVGRNIIHASDGFESATKEIGLWFDEKELASYTPAAWEQVMADN